MDKPAIPTWLLSPPETHPDGPVISRHQVLPFEELSWENFERLTLRLAADESDVEHCQLYGERGEAQQGIDIYAVMRTGSYVVYQCKRQKGFGPDKIRSAVQLFLDGEWVHKAGKLVLCTQESMTNTRRIKEVERQRVELAERSIEFAVWDAQMLSGLLKQKPAVVDDFFGREWVRQFCGAEEAAALSGRLDGASVARLRMRLRQLYSNIFNTHDPGLPVPTRQGQLGLPLTRRFVLPDVLSARTLQVPHRDSATPPSPPVPEAGFADIEGSFRGDKQNELNEHVEPIRRREPSDEWITRSDRTVLLGDPGSGKSSLLRFLALDILSDTPSSAAWALRWGGYLPLWIPFPLWTRMIAENPLTSMRDALHRWFNTWDASEFSDLVQQAMDDRRVLLLVDGLDEWTNRSAAQIALDRLEVFLNERGAAAVVTSRPAGFQQLSLPLERWSVVEVADFSVVQQARLIKVWFEARLAQNLVEMSGEADVVSGADVEARAMIAELASSSDLRELARVPMLLCILITLRFHNARLPQTRFKAFSDIVRHLTLTHPIQRSAAALSPSQESDFSEEEVRRILSFLAYRVHTEHGSGLISIPDAEAVIREFLEDPEGSFGFDRPAARSGSRTMLESARDTFGLLVKRSPTEIGFFHRSVQEYLASVYIASLPLQHVERLLTTNLHDEQWHEVILGVFHHTTRSSDVRNLLGLVRGAPTSLCNAYRAREISYEVALGEFNCPANLARQLAAEAIEVVELGAWRRHRARVLQLVLGGLQTAAVREIIRPKVVEWVAAPVDYRASLFSAIATWPLTPDTVRCLFRGVVDSAGSDQIAAADALSAVAGGDYAVGEELVSLLQDHRDGTVRAAAFKALSQGWPAHPALPEVTREFAQSVSVVERLMSTWHRAIKNDVGSEDWAFLVDFGREFWARPLGWRDLAPASFLAGWAGTDQLKRLAMTGFSNVSAYGGFDRDVSRELLLRGFPQDDEVAARISESMYGKHPEISLGSSNVWQLLHANFRDHPLVVSAIDRRFEEEEVWDPIESVAALVGRTELTKRWLIRSIEKEHFPHWQASVLLEGWGMDDPQVAAALTAVVNSPPARSSRIAHLIPEILKDSDAAFQRLLEIVQDQHAARPEFGLTGIVSLGLTHRETEVLDAAFSWDLERGDHRAEAIRSVLFRHYSQDPRVRELAAREFTRPDGSYTAIALGFGDDETFRAWIAPVANPLPAESRATIVRWLYEGGAERSFARELLSKYDIESSPSVRTEASIAYHTLIKEDLGLREAALSKLAEEIRAVGPQYEMRRQAAFAGLLVLDRLDVMLEMRERVVDGKQLAVPIGSTFRPNVPLLSLIASNWSQIKGSFSQEGSNRLARFGGEKSVLKALLPFAYSNSSLESDLLDSIDGGDEMWTTPEGLEFLGRTRPNSDRFFAACKKAILQTSTIAELEKAVFASRQLAEHHGHRTELASQIKAWFPDDRLYEGLVLALSEGWPQSSELEEIFQSVKREPPRISIVGVVSLTAAKSRAEIVLDRTVEILAGVELRSNHIIPLLVRPLSRRFQSDDVLRNLALARLRGGASPTEKATLPRLAQHPGSDRGRLVRWVHEELSLQETLTLPQVGFDLFDNQVASVAHSLLEVAG
jgi:hypothetical protein